MSRGAAQRFAELVLLGLLHLGTEEMGRHPVGLVDDDQVPIALPDTFDQVLAAGDLVDAADQAVTLLEDVTGVGAVDEVFGDDVETEAELVEQFV
ncbi:MAG: hypothetical protein ACSLFI_03425, partial [Solirubrobacterales bacterium]